MEERLSSVQEKVMPPFMKFCKQLEKEEGVEEKVIEESMAENDWKQVKSVLKKRMVKVDQIERSQLVGLVRTVLGVRNCLVEKEGQEGAEAMQEMANFKYPLQIPPPAFQILLPALQIDDPESVPDTS